MTTADDFLNSDHKPLLPESFFIAGRFNAELPDGDGVSVQGPSSLVFAAHVILKMHGYKITPVAGHFWGPDELSFFPLDLEKSAHDDTAANLVNDVLTGTERARAMYFYDYSDW